MLCYFSFAKIKSVLPEGIAFELDLRMEHLNKLLKCGLKQLGANISEESAQRIAAALQPLETLLANVDKDIIMQKGTQHHGTKDLMQTVKLITEDLVNEKVFVKKPDRQYKSFMNFNSDILHKLDHRNFFNWAKHLFKVWGAMYN